MQCSNTVKDKRIIAIGAKKSIDFGSAMKHQCLFVVFFCNFFFFGGGGGGGESRKKSEKSKLIQQIFLSKNFVYVLPKTTTQAGRSYTFPSKGSRSNVSPRDKLIKRERLPKNNTSVMSMHCVL